MGELLSKTPYARDEYKWAISAYNDSKYTDVYRALAYTLLVTDGYDVLRKTSNGYRGRYNIDWSNNRVPHLNKKVIELGERIRHVSIENMDACELMRRVNRDYTVIYLDPPYLQVTQSLYRYELDMDEMTKLVLDSKARIAISGYGDEWDHLGFKRHTYETFSKLGNTYMDGTKANTKKTEVLWTNYDPDTGQKTHTRTLT